MSSVYTEACWEIPKNKLYQRLLSLLANTSRLELWTYPLLETTRWCWHLHTLTSLIDDAASSCKGPVYPLESKVAWVWEGGGDESMESAQIAMPTADSHGEQHRLAQKLQQFWGSSLRYVYVTYQVHGRSYSLVGAGEGLRIPDASIATLGCHTCNSNYLNSSFRIFSLLILKGSSGNFKWLPLHPLLHSRGLP